LLSHLTSLAGLRRLPSMAESALEQLEVSDDLSILEPAQRNVRALAEMLEGGRSEALTALHTRD